AIRRGRPLSHEETGRGTRASNKTLESTDLRGLNNPHLLPQVAARPGPPAIVELVGRPHLLLAKPAPSFTCGLGRPSFVTPCRLPRRLGARRPASTAVVNRC